MIFYQFLEAVSKNYTHVNGKHLDLHDSVKEEIYASVPFVFTKTDAVESVEHLPLFSDGGAPLDLPFKACFFEILEGNISEIEEDGEDILIAGLYVSEIAPRQYRVAVALKEKGRSDISVLLPDSNDNTLKPILDHTEKITRSLLNRLSKEEIGSANPRHSIKVRTSEGKRGLRISKVVYVTPKKNTSSLETKVSRSIDWSHQWEVRGHWRSVKGKIGRDREGLPITNFTWVRPHVKGPEAAPLVKKARVVQSPEPENPIKLPTIFSKLF